MIKCALENDEEENIVCHFQSITEHQGSLTPKDNDGRMDPARAYL
jgi:hypothetical protein